MSSSVPSSRVRAERSAGGVVIRRAGAIALVLVGEQRDWNTGAESVRLPKGKLDPGESDEQAALREVREESGREARIIGALPQASYLFTVVSDGSTVEKTVAWFAMEDAGEAAVPRDDEMHAIHWLPADEAMRALSFENERQLIGPAIELFEAFERGAGTNRSRSGSD